MTKYIIYAKGPEHDKAEPFEVKTCRRLISERFAEKFTAVEAQRKINVLKFNMSDWTFEAREPGE